MSIMFVSKFSMNALKNSESQWTVATPGESYYKMHYPPGQCLEYVVSSGEQKHNRLFDVRQTTKLAKFMHWYSQITNLSQITDEFQFLERSVGLLSSRSLTSVMNHADRSCEWLTIFKTAAADDGSSPWNNNLNSTVDHAHKWSQLIQVGLFLLLILLHRT